MVLKARHHLIIYPFFKFYSLWKINRHFKKITIQGKYKEDNQAILLISNHVSWWDGFWAMYLNLKVFKKKFHFMMLEDQLRKYWFFNYTGGFSVKKKSRGVLESLQYTTHLLTHQNNLVLIFPQGEIQSMHLQHFKFEKGIERILKYLNVDIKIIFLVNLTDYFSHPKPELFLYFQEYLQHEKSMDNLQESYNEFYKTCVKNQSAILI